MPSSRQDQLHSYQFMVQRVVSVLVMRETDPAHSPFRRVVGATLASVLIALIALGGVAVYGVVAGGGANWRDPAAVIVEKESGARYVFRAEKLHLVLNYASALLIVGSTEPKTVLVSRRSIEGVPRGVPLGITGAPDSLPAADRLSAAPWAVCSMPAGGDGRPAPRSALLVGAAPPGGVPLDDRAVLGRHPDGSLHLVRHDRRHLVRDETLVLTALGWTGVRPVPLAPALLNALPVGADLAGIRIVDHGQSVTELPGARVGEVFVVASQDGGRQYAVAGRGGLAGITQVQADLLLTALGQDRPTELSQGRFAGLPRIADLVPTGDAAPPATTPRLVDAGSGATCGIVRDDAGGAEVRVGVTTLAVGESVATGARSDHGAALADHVVVVPGRGAVVEATAAPGAAGAISIVTDLGLRHTVSGVDVLAVLGLGAVRPQRLPANLVALVPAGAALDPEAARAAATVR
ncbi:type VII secretion protein EccB [Polymorphospora rubra]|uniref:Type VII secretion protein EccB n=1 Tax=Polymorphospora rubra TaxID=338584 RepID=A0A810N046_9ACTN|nr:type VII secretion protein EccB [Polymorphospora rubra]BCJ65163.1 type VII secretion protein EccB [Polymorphospora rubra]